MKLAKKVEAPTKQPDPDAASDKALLAALMALTHAMKSGQALHADAAERITKAIASIQLEVPSPAAPRKRKTIKVHSIKHDQLGNMESFLITEIDP